MRSREVNTGARRSVLVPLCAVVGATLCLLIAQTSCLNPVPDDYPSNEGRPVPVVETTAPAAGAPSLDAEPEAPRPMDQNGAPGDLVVDEPTPDAGAASADAGTDAGARDGDAVE